MLDNFRGRLLAAAKAFRNYSPTAGMIEPAHEEEITQTAPDPWITSVSFHNGTGVLIDVIEPHPRFSPILKGLLIDTRDSSGPEEGHTRRMTEQAHAVLRRLPHLRGDGKIGAFGVLGTAFYLSRYTNPDDGTCVEITKSQLYIPIEDYDPAQPDQIPEALHDILFFLANRPDIIDRDLLQSSLPENIWSPVAQRLWIEETSNLSPEQIAQREVDRLAPGSDPAME